MDFDKILSVAGNSISIILIVIITWLTNKILRIWIDKREELQLRFVKHFISGFIYLIGTVSIMYTIPPLRNFSTSILAGSGIMAVIIGFASQQAFSNIVGGIFIAIFKPFIIGDRVSFIGKGFTGVVEDITLRHTIVRTFENKRIVIPNSVVSVEMIENANFAENEICKFFDITISYQSDIDKAMKIIEEEGIAHPDVIDHRTPEEIKDGVPEVAVKVLNLIEYGVRLRAWIWSKDPSTAFAVFCDLNYKIKKRFDKEGIIIPYPTQTIYSKKVD